MKVLVTGGAGYIGSHTLIELNKAGFDFVVFDNLCNSSYESLKRVENIIGKSVDFEEGDIRNSKALSSVFENYDIDSVIHFAGLKAVGESVSKPHMYYDNNINGTLILCEVMKKYGCKKIVFSSSSTVYGVPHTTPIQENFPVGATTNPYGRTKYFIEEMLRDIYVSDNTNKIVLLRYFNPVGAHESGTIGEDPNGIPNNLMPFISQTAVGKREYLSVFGGDYDTEDGTGVRDYIHVVDLALGHVKALEKMDSIDDVLTVNLGTGNGYSVLDMIKAFEKASNKKVPYRIVERRAGDIAKCFADPSYAKEVLDWEAQHGIDKMCEDTWVWQLNNPNGYKS
ncbi:UDP-glucose 4-epimerase GalE [Poseidonibacter lekithochrous]|uniref:UDP-glucose 4-epimerase GalE n=1 Tax=Poseidonibacter lekithochrous TaxID=1904463 RepID=UPI000D398B5B|nr:UDP-glucose 4-epimerase GalE [Poseidonibacter lekithochrous]